MDDKIEGERPTGTEALSPERSKELIAQIKGKITGWLRKQGPKNTDPGAELKNLAPVVPESLQKDGGFRVEINNPEEIYNQRMERRDQGFQALQTGLFSAVRNTLKFHSPSILEAKAEARVALYYAERSYWSEEEARRLSQRLKSSYPDKVRIEHSIREGDNIIWIDDPDADATYCVYLGPKTEQDNRAWQEMLLEEGKELVEEGEMTPEELKEKFPEPLIEVIQGLRPLENEPLTIVMSQRGYRHDQGGISGWVEVKNRRDFIQRITGFARCLDRIINAISQVKEIPIVGKVTI